MKVQTLRRALAWQWTIFAAALLLGFALVAVLALYILEDSFIDQRLLAAEEALSASQAPSPPVLLMRPGDLPESARALVSDLPPRALREFRLDDGRYLHLRALPADGQGARFLAIDAREELRVNDALRRAAPTLLGVTLVVLLLAAWLAARFVRRIERGMAGLLDAIDQGGDAASIHALAAKQPVQEFRRFGSALAEALDARLAAVQREAETVRFLAHELRTPLQSARLAFAALSEDASGHAGFARLQRSLQRLERASAAVLWLGESAPEVEELDIGPLVQELVDEFAPLAAQRGQTIRVEPGPEFSWPLPRPAAEAVLANLLLNAVQHGAPGSIGVRWDRMRFEVENPIDAEDDRTGFGLGLDLARRLLFRIGWQIDARSASGTFRAELRPSAKPGL